MNEIKKEKDFKINKKTIIFSICVLILLILTIFIVVINKNNKELDKDLNTGKEIKEEKKDFTNDTKTNNDKEAEEAKETDELIAENEEENIYEASTVSIALISSTEETSFEDAYEKQEKNYQIDYTAVNFTDDSENNYWTTGKLTQNSTKLNLGDSLALDFSLENNTGTNIYIKQIITLSSDFVMTSSAEEMSITFDDGTIVIPTYNESHTVATYETPIHLLKNSETKNYDLNFNITNILGNDIVYETIDINLKTSICQEGTFGGWFLANNKMINYETTEIPCYLATDSDFEGEYDGDFHYIGSETRVEIPQTIKGEELTSYQYMFEGTDVTKVVSTNPNIDDMEGMFYESTALSIDLTELNTSNVYCMWNMFYDAAATEIDISTFDTTNLEDMDEMFYNTKIDTIDLSSFDTSNVCCSYGTFAETVATTGYARSQEDADFLNASEEKPETLTFVFEPPFTYEGTFDFIDNTTNSAWTTQELTQNNELLNTGEAVPLNFSITNNTDINLNIKNTITLSSNYFMAENEEEMMLTFDDGTEVIPTYNECYDTATYELPSTLLDISNTENYDLNFNLRDISDNYLAYEIINITLKTYASKASTNSEWIILNNKTITYETDAPVLAKSSDFEGEADGEFHYIGTATEITIPYAIKGINLTSYDGMFSKTSVTKVVSSNENIISMKNMFSSTTSDHLDLSKINTSNVTDMSYMFESSDIGSLDISLFDTSNVTDMSYMFNSAWNLKSLNLDSFNTTKVTNMSHMFDNMFSVNTLDVSPLNTSNVTDMSYMFYSTTGLTSLDLSGFNTSNVTNMSHMFGETRALQSLNLTSFNTSNVTDMSYFINNSEVNILDISSFDTSNVTNMKGMFKSNQFSSLDLSGFDTTKVTDMSGMFMYLETSILNLSSFNTSNVTDMSYMFSNAQIETINLSSFNTSNVTTMYRMFNETETGALDLSSFNTAKVTTMYYMFNECTASSLNLSSFDISNVTNMEFMFYGSLVDVLDLSSFNSSNSIKTRWMFYGAASTVIDISGWDLGHMWNTELMFYIYQNPVTIYCSSEAEISDLMSDLTESEIPETVTFAVKE